MNEAERGQVLGLHDVLRPRKFLDGLLGKAHGTEENIYDFDKMYTGSEGRAFTTEAGGKMTGFIGVKKLEEGELLIDQIRVGDAADAEEIVRALIEKVIAYAKEKGKSKINIVISDTSGYAHALERLDFHRVNVDGSDRFFEKQI